MLAPYKPKKTESDNKFINKHKKYPCIIDGNGLRELKKSTNIRVSDNEIKNISIKTT